MSIRKALWFALAVLMLAACFGVVGCTQSQSEQPAQPEIIYENVPAEYQDLFHGGFFDFDNVWRTDDEAYGEMTGELRRFCEKTYNGSLLVATDDKVIFAGGFEAKETDGETTVNPFTTYEIGSVTKQFCAAAILQQVQAGKIDPSDTIDKYFPDYPYAAEITVDQLLHMAGGVPDMVRDTDIGDFFWNNEDFINGTMSDEEQLRIIGGYSLYPIPETGEGYRYSNSEYWMLALILEQVTGQSYEEYIQKNIFDVCRMPCSSCCEKGNLTSAPEMGGEYHTVSRCCRGTGDIHSNVCDILRWDRTLLNEKKILDAERMEYMFDFPNGYSCGWVDEGDGNFSHSGATPGYAAYNSVYKTSDGKNLYLIQMTGHTGKSKYSFESVFEIIEKYLP